MRVAIRADASPLIGGGHVMRCLTLADRLARQGASVTLLAAAMPAPLERLIVESGHELLRIAAVAELLRDDPDWHEAVLDDGAQARDASLCADMLDSKVDWLVADHYLLGEAFERAARGFADRILVIDELANRRHDCDLLLDQTLGRDPADYGQLVPDSARVLAGTGFALLREEFARERHTALERRAGEGPVGRILIAPGTTDICRLGPAALTAAMDLADNARIDVLIGSDAVTRSNIEALAATDQRVSVHLDGREVARMMSEADVAIGAGGTTSWERCCLGLPTVIVPVAGNQRPSAVALADAGAALVVDGADGIAAALAELVGKPELRLKMSAAAFAIADGEGAARVVSAMIGEEGRTRCLRFRPAAAEDSVPLWLWRNDPTTRRMSQSTDPVPLAAHQGWFEAALGSPERIIWIAEADEPVGMVRFDRAGEKSWEISINLNPAERGKGIGTEILSRACEQFARDHGGATLRALVRADNLASRRLFERCGFIAAGQAPGASDFLVYLLEPRRGVPVT